MSYIIKHAKTGKYFNIKPFGLDVFNIGINPKVYPTEDAAIQDLLLFPALKSKQLQTNYNTFRGLVDHGKPIWYEERKTKKLTKKQQEKLEWYENAQSTTAENKVFLLQLDVTDLVIEEYKP